MSRLSEGGGRDIKPIYIPSGRAGEYGDFAINIYTGCPHRCYYCFAPDVLHKDREAFHSNIVPRNGIVKAVKRQLDKERITGKLIHLCFTCDPYPVGYDATATREVIKLLKAAGNHVQILTKGDGSRDFDLLDSEDWYGITLTGTAHQYERKSETEEMRIMALVNANGLSIKTWVSCEPVLYPSRVLGYIESAPWVDKWKIGKLNYHPSNIDWAEFGKKVEALCKRLGCDYYIKADLRVEMDKK